MSVNKNNHKVVKDNTSAKSSNIGTTKRWWVAKIL